MWMSCLLGIPSCLNRLPQQSLPPGIGGMMEKRGNCWRLITVVPVQEGLGPGLARALIAEPRVWPEDVLACWGNKNSSWFLNYFSSCDGFFFFFSQLVLHLPKFLPAASILVRYLQPRFQTGVAPLTSLIHCIISLWGRNLVMGPGPPEPLNLFWYVLMSGLDSETFRPHVKRF